MGLFLREDSDSPSAYLGYPWLIAGISCRRRCEICVLPPPPWAHEGMEAVSQILSKCFNCEVRSTEEFATMSFLIQAWRSLSYLPCVPWVLQVKQRSMAGVCASREGFTAKLLHTVLPEALITLDANMLPSGFVSLGVFFGVCLFFFKLKASEVLMEHLIASEPPEIVFPFPLSCTLSVKWSESSALSPFVGCW